MRYLRKMLQHGSLSLFISGLAGPAALAAQPDISPCHAAAEKADALLGDPQGSLTLQPEIASAATSLADTSWAPGFCKALQENLDSKLQSQKEGAHFTKTDVINTAIRFEAFRITAFRNAGVAPKRYFGFLDEQGHTAAYEKTLKETAVKISALLNAYAKAHGMKITISPKEIIVTHLAEGGAMLLTDGFSSVENIHPVYGIGLDDFRIGFKEYPGLLEQVDAAFATKLGDLAVSAQDNGNIAMATNGFGGLSELKRWATGSADDRPAKYRMTFVESILGTAVMYFYEKDLAEKKLLADHLPPLEARPLDEQYAIASLVYNSGILFAPERIAMVMNFSTGPYLLETSEKTAQRATNPRPRLPLVTAAEADQILREGKSLPQQMTSWNAVYHIMQRYGAWMALKNFTADFDAAGNLAR